MMHRSLLLTVLFCLLMGCATHLTPAISAPPATTPATTPARALATLTIRVTDLRNHTGQLLFGVFKSPDGFPQDKRKATDWQIKSIDADTVVFTSSLPPGKYAVAVLHDENKNGKMDMNFLGIPEEGYGVTNNPKPEYRQAKFEEAVFDLPADGKTMTVSLQYF